MSHKTAPVLTSSVFLLFLFDLIGNALSMACQAGHRNPCSSSMCGTWLVFTSSAVWRHRAGRHPSDELNLAVSHTSYKLESHLASNVLHQRQWAFDFYYLMLEYMKQNVEQILCLSNCVSYVGEDGCSFWIRLTICHIIPSFLSL